MYDKKPLRIWAFGIGLLFLSASLLAQPTESLKIIQAQGEFAIDGDLKDWAAVQEVPVLLTPEGDVLALSSDLTVTARFSFDAGSFYAAVTVQDDRLEFPGRSRREGDGFYLTFVDPEGMEGGGRFLSFGFSRFEGQPLALLFKDGGFNTMAVQDVELKTKEDQDKGEIIYELAIPWKYFPDFRPFIRPNWSVNLSYDDLDAGQKKVVQLAPDPGYEPDKPGPKKAMPAEFVAGPAQSLEFQSMLNANHFFPEDERNINLAVHSPDSRQGWQVRMIATTSLGNFSSEKTLEFESGLNVLSFPVQMEKLTTGMVDLSLGVLDDQGRLRFTDDHRFFVFDGKQFDDYEAKLSALREGELAKQDPVFRESLPTLEIRLLWIREFMKEQPAFANLESVQEWNSEIRDLFRKVEEGKPSMFPTGRIARLGYRTEADGSPKSYWAFIPDWYEKETALPLLVTLSGERANLRGALLAMTTGSFGPRARKRAGDFFLLAPEVEDPSSWYIGADGQRVLETIEHFKKLYNVDAEAVVLHGSAKGGYEVLRLALQNQGVYRGVIVRFGQLTPPLDSGAENLADMLDRAKGLNVLLVHAGQSKEAQADNVRAIAARLEEARANVRLIETKSTGLRDFDKWSDVYGWLRDVWGDAVVELKPPKKEKSKERDREK